MIVIVCLSAERIAVKCGRPSDNFNGLFGGSRLSWNQFKGLRKATADSYSTKIAAIRRQDSVNVPSFSHCGNGAINQAEVEPCESCIKFHGSGNVERKRWFVLVSCPWIEDIRDQPSHGCTVVSEKVVNLRENEPGHDYRTR
jgi:hypothetical protein